MAVQDAGVILQQPGSVPSSASKSGRMPDSVWDDAADRGEEDGVHVPVTRLIDMPFVHRAEEALSIDQCTLQDVGARLNICSADVEVLKKQVEQLSGKVEGLESVRRGQLDCISERIYDAEKHIRQAEERQDDAIEKASATFQKQSSNLMHVINQVNSNFEHLSKQIASQGVTLAGFEQSISQFQADEGEHISNQQTQHALSELQMSVQAMRQSMLRMTPLSQFSEAEARLRSMADRVDSLQQMVDDVRAIRETVLRMTPAAQFAEAEQRHRALAERVEAMQKMLRDIQVRAPIDVPATTQRSPVVIRPTMHQEILDMEQFHGGTPDEIAARRRMATSVVLEGVSELRAPVMMVQQAQPQSATVNVVQNVGSGQWLFEAEGASSAPASAPAPCLTTGTVARNNRGPMHSENAPRYNSDFFQDIAPASSMWESTADDSLPCGASGTGDRQSQASCGAMAHQYGLAHIPKASPFGNDGVFRAAGSTSMGTGCGQFEFVTGAGAGDDFDVQGFNAMPDAPAAPATLMTAGYEL